MSTKKEMALLSLWELLNIAESYQSDFSSLNTLSKQRLSTLKLMYGIKAITLKSFYHLKDDITGYYV